MHSLGERFGQDEAVFIVLSMVKYLRLTDDFQILCQKTRHLGNAVEIDGNRLIPEPRGNRPHKLTHSVLIADLVVGRSLASNVA